MPGAGGLRLATFCFCGRIIATAARAAAAGFVSVELAAYAAADEKHADRDAEDEDDVLPQGVSPPLVLSGKSQRSSALIDQGGQQKSETGVEADGKQPPFPGAGLLGDAHHCDKAGCVKHDKDDEG